MSVRKAAIGKIELEAKGCAQLLNAAADEQDPGHTDYRVLAEGFLASKKCNEGIPGSILGEYDNVAYPEKRYFNYTAFLVPDSRLLCRYALFPLLRLLGLKDSI